MANTSPVMQLNVSKRYRICLVNMYIRIQIRNTKQSTTAQLDGTTETSVMKRKGDTLLAFHMLESSWMTQEKFPALQDEFHP